MIKSIISNEEMNALHEVFRGELVPTPKVIQNANERIEKDIASIVKMVSLLNNVDKHRVANLINML
jgi:hypothetical protein